MPLVSRSFRRAAPLLLSGLLAGALPLAAESPVKPAASAPKATKKLPPIFDPEIIGTKAIEAGVKVCNETGRRPFVVFGTNDCDPCRTFNDALHENVFCNAVILQFVPILIDATPGGRNAGLLKNYGIDPKQGFPAVGVFELSSTPPEITRNGEMVEVAKKGTQAVHEWITARFRKDRPTTVSQ